MADFNPNPYRGEASIPHVSEEFFKVYFIGAQVRKQMSACLHFPGSCLTIFLHHDRIPTTPPILIWEDICLLRSHKINAMQLALGFLLFPGRILGSEIRPRKYK